MHNILVSQTPSLRIAYAQALNQYQPWHQHGAWNSTGNDAFWQLIKGGLDIGFFNLEQAAKMFGVPQVIVQQWADGTVPDRKTRIKVWKTLKKLPLQPAV